MQSKEVMDKLLRRGFRNKQKITKSNFSGPAIKYQDRYNWVVYTDDNTTQNSLSAYLNSQGWDNKMEIINYRGKFYTSFPIISLEMLSWLKKNPTLLIYTIYHQRYTRYDPWVKLKPTTIVV